MPLGQSLFRPLSEFRCASLVGQLDRPERRLVPINENCLYVFPFDGRTRLEKQPNGKILGEELIGLEDVDPRGLRFRIGIQNQPLRRVFKRKTGRNLVPRLGGPQP